MRLALALLALAAPAAAAGIPDFPASHTTGDALKPLADIGATAAPGVDGKARAKEDKEEEAAGAAPRFAITNEVKVVAGPKEWETAGDGTKVWRHRVTAGAGCRHLNFGFGKYHMPKGGKLWITDLRGKPLGRPYTAANNALGELWTAVVPSCKVVLEVNLPAKTPTKDQPVLELTSVNVGYKGFGAGAKSGSCNVDVVCGAGDGDAYAPIDEWRNEIPSVAVMSRDGSRFCTGSLLNNAKWDRTPYFLTAHHCGVRGSNAASLVTYWKYETSTCGGTPDGQLDNVLTGGATLVVENPASDMTLVRLTDDIPEEWVDGGIAGFAGWDRSGVEATSAVAIHHPSTDEKRISFENQPTTTTSYGGGSGSNHVQVADWDLGTTEPGSSGSPLFNQDHRVIGQLHGGTAACGNDLPDYYGKFSVSWDSAGLAQWLDPDGTGVAFVDTLGSGPPPPPTPPTTPPPTAAPTPCAGVDVRVNVLTDEYPGETSFALVNDCTGQQVWEGSYSQAEQQHSDEKCLPAARYTFTIFDSHGDGLCCGWGSGSYEVFYDGVSQGSGDEFDDSESLTFGNCAPPTTPPPTTSPPPTDAPTTAPSDAPTTSDAPTKAPTDAPTKAPTDAPTPCTGVDIQVDVLTDGYASETSWNLIDECTEQQVWEGSYTLNDHQHSDVKCLPAAKYTWTINDSYADGICCSYGQGSYEVFYDGETQGSGGDFGDSDSLTFGSCDGLPPTPVAQYHSTSKWCWPVDEERCQEVASHLDRTFKVISNEKRPGGCSVFDSSTDKVFYNSENEEGKMCRNNKKCVCHPYDLHPKQHECASPLTEAACEDAATAVGAEYNVVTESNTRRPRGCYRMTTDGSVRYNNYDENENGKGCSWGRRCVCEASGVVVDE